MQSQPVTHRIYATAFELLERHPEGLRWSELLAQIQASDPGFHPKTVNGCVWKLVERFPDEGCKSEKGLFRLAKHEGAAKEQGRPQCGVSFCRIRPVLRRGGTPPYACRGLSSG